MINISQIIIRVFKLQDMSIKMIKHSNIYMIKKMEVLKNTVRIKWDDECKLFSSISVHHKHSMYYLTLVNSTHKC